MLRARANRARAHSALLLRFLLRFFFLRPYRVRGALNEGLDFHHILFFQLAGEVRHALILEGTVEDEVFQVRNRLGRDIAEIPDVAALVDAGHTVAEHAVADIEQRAGLYVSGIVLHTFKQARHLVLGEVGWGRLATDGEGEDRSRPFHVGRPRGLPKHTAPADRNRDILYAIDGVGCGSGDDSGAGWRLPQLLTRCSVVTDKASIRRALEHQIDSGGQGAAIPRRHIILLPDLLLLDRIPGDQAAEWQTFRRLHIGEIAKVPAQSGMGLAGIVGIVRPVLIPREVYRNILRGNVDQAGLRIERQRVPVVRTVGSRDAVEWLVTSGLRDLDRPSIGVITGGPVHIDKILCRDELAVGAIDDEKETVLRRMQNDFSRRVVDIDVGEDHRLGRGVIPAVAGCLLVVPDIFAGVGIQRDNGSEIEIIAAGGAAHVPVPGRTVSGADVDQVQVWIEGDAVPDGTATAVDPPLAGRIPSFRGGCHRVVLERLAWIAGNDKPSPGLRAGLGIVCSDVAPHAILGAAISDHYLAVEHARRAGDGVRMAVVGDGVLFPDFVASDCVERDQPAIIGADENLAFVERDATVDDIAAAFVALLAIYSGIEAPDSLAGPRIDGVHHAPGCSHIHDAVDHDRRRFDAADRFEIVAPHQSEIFDVVGVDLVELAETGLGIVEAGGRPVLRGRRVGLDRGAVCADSDAETFNTL